MIIPDPREARVFRQPHRRDCHVPRGAHVGAAGVPRIVVLVGVLILAGAQNTSIVGANGVLNRMAEDGVLTSAFQKPHPRFGTSYRVINLIVVLQLLTIILTHGNVFILAGLYAFGVIWSFSFMSLAVVVLRYKEPGNREWRVPAIPKYSAKKFHWD